jgi:hypothetical protein
VRKFVSLCLLSVLTFNYVLVTSPTLHAAAPQNGRIAFVTDDSPSEIHTINPDGDNVDEKTFKYDPGGMSSYYNAQYSPDGTKLAYIEAVSPTIFYIDAVVGSNLTTLNDGRFYGGFGWHPGGSKIVTTASFGGFTFDIYSMNSDGSSLTQLTNSVVNKYNPRVSPDGTKIVHERAGGDDIFIMNADGTGLTDLTSADYTTAAYPSWSPDGTKIIYYWSDGGSSGFATMNPDGTGKTDLTTAVPGGPAIYSPDGTKIAYIDSTKSLHIMDADGTDDAIYAHDAVTLSWQSLTSGPTSTNANPTVTLTNSKATVDIPSLYSDPYGNGIDKSSVSVTSTPQNGTTSIDGNGVVTYNLKTTAKRTILNSLASIFFPTVSAASGSDSFTYRVCSTSGTGLCSTGTVFVNLAGSLASTGSDSNQLTILAWSLVILSVIGFAHVIRRMNQIRR